jgi:xylulokinase
MAIVVGIDVGTQSTKVLAYDTQTRSIVGLTQAPHELIAREDGTREQEASWWAEAITTCFAKLPEHVRRDITAIGVSGQQHGFVPLGGEGTVLRPVKLWNDTSTVSECNEITSAAGGKYNLLANEGNLILTGYTAPKILWLRTHHRDLYDRMEKILLPHDWVNFFLTGTYVMEHGDASGTALLDIRERQWSQRLLKILDPQRDLSKALPPLIDADGCAGTVNAAAAKRLGIPEGIFVSAGGGDNMMGAIGTAVVRDGMLAMSLGTSGTVFGSSSKPIIDPQGRLAAFCSSSGSWLPLLCTMNCTVATEMTRTLFSLGVKDFDRKAAQAPIGSKGVVMLPYFNGERTPDYPHGRGCLMGFTLDNMNEECIARSAMESAIFGLRYGLDAFRELGFEPRGIQLIGGGAKSELWRQMTADTCDVPVQVPAVAEAAAFGAALQAWWAYRHSCGEQVALEEIVDSHVVMEGKKYLPDAESVRQYGVAYGRYMDYVKAMEPLFS